MAERATYGARRLEQVLKSDLAAAFAAGTARILVCASCGREVVAYVAMHDQAMQQCAALGIELSVSCFECGQESDDLSPAMKAAQRSLFEANTRGAVVTEGAGGEVEVVAFESAPAIPSKGRGHVH